MKRAYLEEDVELIQKYFPGAKTVTIRTPFDLTQRPARIPRMATDSVRTTDGRPAWNREALWTN
jgi:hypothetical protein